MRSSSLSGKMCFACLNNKKWSAWGVRFLWRCMVRLLLYEIWRRIVWWIYQTIRRRVSEGRRVFFVLHTVLRQLREHVTASYWPAGTRSWAGSISVPCSQSILQRSPSRYPHSSSVFKCLPPPPHSRIVFIPVTTCTRDLRYHCLSVRRLSHEKF
jgi:hypothetical protein